MFHFNLEEEKGNLESFWSLVDLRFRYFISDDRDFTRDAESLLVVDG